jgi:uncharacterized protein (TIGR02466 family)
MLVAQTERILSGNTPMLLFSTINNIQLRFPTPVLVVDWPGAVRHNRALLQLIEQKQAASQSVSLSNQGGWQSTDDIFEWGGEAVAGLSNWIRRCIYSIHYTYHQDEFTAFLEANGGELTRKLVGWANVNYRGHWNSMHNHPNCHWSGCYYVQVPPGSGNIALFDPRGCVNMNDTGVGVLDLFRQAPQQIEAREGMMIVFPSWLQHHVTDHNADQPRISIAFNWRFLL